MAAQPQTLAVPDFHARDVDFGLDAERVTDWAGDPWRTLFFNTLSITFPAGERFFINSVAQHREQITDPQLRAHVNAFVSQEALHTREHIAYNEAIGRVLDTAPLEAGLARFLDFIKRSTSPQIRLAVTCALEHFTAIMAKDTLERPEHLRGAEPQYARLWTWHALEECEHKAVSFDVYQRVTDGRANWLRMFVMIPTSLILFFYLAKFAHALMRAQGHARSPVAWAKLLWAAYGSPGLMRRIIPSYLKYFNPRFHPNDIDDHAVLANTKRLVDAWI